MKGVLNEAFGPRDCSVYAGRELLGRYLELAPRRIVAFDSRDREIGTFRKRKDACAAISAAHHEALRRG